MPVHIHVADTDVVRYFASMSMSPSIRSLPADRETAPSFLSRLAALRGVSAKDFAYDMGFSLKRILELEDTALNSLVRLADLEEEAAEELASWTDKRAGNVRMVFRGETIVSRALRNPVVRGCPCCLRQDAASHDGPSLQVMAMRGDWQLRLVSICPRHGHPLVDLWEAAHPTHRYDIGARLGEVEREILSGDFDQVVVEATPYDLWLDARLSDGSDTTWLAGHSLYASATFCQLLGAELLALEGHQEADESTRVWLARAAGFGVARRGEAAIRDALDRLASRATGHLDEPRKAFGDLLPKLSRDHLHEEDFAPFRSLLRNCILDIWPVAAGDIVVGEQVSERRLHSLISASRETGVGTFLLSQFLIEAGAISEDDDRPTARKTFDVQRFSALLEEIPTLVGPIEMRNSMRATRHQFQALVADGVLVPRTGIPTVKSPWRLEDGSALIMELLHAARSISPDDEDWEHIHRAHIRSGLGVGVIVEAIRSGRLTVGQREDLAGYSGIFVLKQDVDGLAKSRRVKAARPEPTAAEFGRSVGMRDGGRFMALLAAGHSTATPMTNPKTGATQLYMTEGDVEAFHARFLTLPTMAAEFGEHRRTLLARIRAAGLRPFGPDNQDYGHLYLRESVEPVLR